MARNESHTISMKQIVKKGEPFEQFSLLDDGFNDCDLNGENGLEYVSEEAQENGFDNDLEYWDSILPNKKVKTLKQLEENWIFLMQKVEYSSSYYEEVEPEFESFEVENSIVVIASALITTNT